jgi:hypothetical protein
MIRLIILALGLFLFWLNMFSGASKKNKRIFSGITVLLMLVIVFIESAGTTPRSGVISREQIAVCGATSAEHSYRSNYNVSFCLQNNATQGTVKRLDLRFSALSCATKPCQTLSSATKSMSMEIAPGKQLEQTENLSFDQLSSELENLTWQVEVIDVKATK